VRRGEADKERGFLFSPNPDSSVFNFQSPVLGVAEGVMIVVFLMLLLYRCSVGLSG
jgi:hypothetical protein